MARGAIDVDVARDADAHNAKRIEGRRKRTFLVGLVRKHLARALPSPLGLELLLSFLLPPMAPMALLLVVQRP